MKRNFFILCAFVAALTSTLLSSCLDEEQTPWKQCKAIIEE